MAPTDIYPPGGVPPVAGSHDWQLVAGGGSLTHGITGLQSLFSMPPHKQDHCPAVKHKLHEDNQTTDHKLLFSPCVELMVSQISKSQGWEGPRGGSRPDQGHLCWRQRQNLTRPQLMPGQEGQLAQMTGLHSSPDNFVTYVLLPTCAAICAKSLSAQKFSSKSAVTKQ
ncbi:MAG: hypothetical protein FRX49_10952 [Trebouxia sp. A1-2]|nr:MAG: hypothetical protein FRX49_10952 [Trebouxia sp. A1-2]